MSLLFESIACIDGKLQNLAYHEERMSMSRSDVLGLSNEIFLDTIDVPKESMKGLWKCRVSYRETIEEIEFRKYKSAEPRYFRLINSEISYAYKFEDRSELDALFKKRGSSDDIIIVVDGFITDTSYGNLLFKDGNKWITPEQPLLQGTMRASLLDSGRISPEKITVSDLMDFSAFMLINALNPFDENRALPIERIRD